MNGEASLWAIPADLPRNERIGARVVLTQLSGWRNGFITIELPNGRTVQFGDVESDRRVTISVTRWRFFWRALTGDDIGVGESYMDGDWHATDLVELCRLYLLDHSLLATPPAWRLGSRIRNAMFRHAKRNTLRRSPDNIRRHYDLSNAFYGLFLDPSMTYSSAVFEGAGDSLEEAQERKIDQICRRLGLAPGIEVLEIGSGWGAFALHAARHYGCRVTSLTLSENQLALARERARAAGLESQVDFRLLDYRNATGSFDRIVSIEMLEAVGYEYFETFFAKCASLLKPAGRMLIQSITFPDQRYDEYRKDLDFIRRHIFPGGILPSLFEITRTVRDATDLRIRDIRDIGLDYARTLRLWRERFLDRLPEVRDLGFDERFIRMWEFYLASCEAGFSLGFLSDLQIVFERPLTRAIIPPRGALLP